MTSNVRVEDILALFRNPRYRALEESIARELGEPISTGAETMASHSAQELALSGLTLVQVQDLLEEAGPLAIRFGILLNHGEEPHSHEEEWDPDEGNQQPAKVPRQSLGFGVGFGLSYLIYIAKLKTANDADLLRYLRDRRIPHAARFAKRLRKYLDRASAF